MVRPLGEVLQTIGGYGFHIYDDSGARWITISYKTEDTAKKAKDLIAKALVMSLQRRCASFVRRNSEGLASMSATIGVSMVPGHTALMRTPLAAYSSAAGSPAG
jgi:hypothetical protein